VNSLATRQVEVKLQSSGSGPSGAVGSLSAERGASGTERWSLIAAGALAVFYLVSSLYIARERPFWTDEILTVDIAHLPNYATIWSAVTHAVDGGSPVYDVLVRWSDQVFGGGEVSARLPSALAMVAGLLIAFDCARRLTDGLHGLIALCVLTSSFLPYYGHEARSYALFFMLAALSLWVWLHTSNDSRASAMLFGAIFFLAVAMHYYAVLCLAPYVLWEIYCWRRPSRKLIAGAVGAVLPLLLLLPAIVSFAPVVVAYNRWASPSFASLMDVFPALFPGGLWLLALIAIWIALADNRDKKVVLQPRQAGETIGWLFLCIPLVGFAVAELKTNAFLGRYFIGVLPGVAIAAACLVWRRVPQARRVSLGILLILAIFGVTKQVMAIRYPDHYAPVRQVLGLEKTLRDDGKRFFVVCNQARYLEAQHYSNHPNDYVLLASLDSGDLRQTMALARYYPMQIWTLNDLRKHTGESAVILPTPRILNELKEAGFEVEMKFSRPLEVAYLR